MIVIDRYRPADRPALDGLYRRVLGDERAEALRERWEWTYLRNPVLPGGAPLIWLAREGEAVVGQYATMPVRLSVEGREIDAAWGTDVMVAPEGQRKGLGQRLFTAWDEHVGASIGLGLTDASHGVFKKLGWPDLGNVPRFVKRLTRAKDSGATQPLARLERAGRRIAARLHPIGGDVRLAGRIDDRFTRLWERVAPRFAFIVRRDAAYMTWKYAERPQLGHAIAVRERNGELAGYVVYRHVAEPQGLVTLLVDFLAEPDDAETLQRLLRWVERDALAAGSQLVRVFTTCSAFHPTFRRAGYEAGPPGMRLVAKINALQVPDDFYRSAERWHVTLGDSDGDR
jgi:GNAT superfamily N-acetyltransferase